ncbi:ATP-dependent DNA helicase [Nephila pilipes]|uniref:ATP-dependent DNA helicase n=1 Tax=Nephila pilipes TaxID=299642 RepID=A0A8X6QYM1_NEPPI|nr:ATP-dependent DNA helicase [Nephila pilipes]
MASVRANETPEESATRRQINAVQTATARANETKEQVATRRQNNSVQTAAARASVSAEEQEEMLQIRRNARTQRLASVAEFYNYINTFCDQICQICHQLCYPNQVVKFNNSTPKEYLPGELYNEKELLVCNREIPDEILALTQPELRLLQRIIPYVKVIKYGGRFGQYGFKGNAILFALDIFQVSEKLPDMLPRSSENAAIVIVTETLDNLNHSRDHTISRDRVYAALRWLVKYNRLYKDVAINHFARLESEDIIRVIPAENNEDINPEIEQHDNDEETRKSTKYKRVSDNSRIVHASWNQSHPTFSNAGYQCYAMVVANMIRASILPPPLWNRSVLDENMLAADRLHSTIKYRTNQQPRAFDILQSEYLFIRNFDVVQDNIRMFGRNFLLNYDEDNWYIAGSLNDGDNDNEFNFTIHQALTNMFNQGQNSCIFVSGSKTLGVMHQNKKYYFTDSHACGERGAPARGYNGKACIIECDTIEELVRILRRVVGSSSTAFAMYYIDVVPIDVENDELEKPGPIEDIVEHEPESENNLPFVSMQTAVMAPIDYNQSIVENELEVSENVNEIVRKTKDNIVNVNHEKRAEEYAWYYLFPYGVHGLNEDRPVKITTLDYFQSRIVGQDTRFQRTDYLFYALHMMEYDRIRSTINTCGKKIRGKEGAIEDVHIQMRSIRGSSAYWRTAMNELIAFIKCVGPPTWFITLSCNDLNWLDMRKALLIADKRPGVDPASICIDEAHN